MTRTFKTVLVHAAIVSLGLVTLTGCPTAPEVKPPEIAAAPRIIAFSANPARIGEPGEITLAWEVEGATEIKIVDPARGEISGIDNRAAGSLKVNVEGNTLFVLSARNPRGVVDSAAVGIELESGVEEVQFFVSPSRIEAEESVVVAWSAPGARAVSLEANGSQIDLQGQRSSGSVVLTPMETTRYVFKADNVTREETVVVQPRVLDFSASTQAVPRGGQVTLSWRTAGATQVQIEEGSRGVLMPAVTEQGQVREGSFTDAIVPQEVDPRTVFSYRLRVTTPEGEFLRDLKVYVAGEPHITSFEVPKYSRINQNTTLRWTTVEARQIEIRTGGVVIYQSRDSADAASGELTIPSPTASTLYTITATGYRGGSDEQSGTTDPVGAPAISNLRATPPDLVTGGQAVVLEWSMSGNRSVRLRAIDGLHAYVADDATETGSVTVYPNETSDYELVIDNGLGELATQTVTVAVTSPVTMTATDEPPFIENSDIAVTFPGGDQGAQIFGYPHDDVAYRSASPNFIDITNTGTELSFSSNDNSTSRFTPPNFETFAWGARYDGEVSANINGWAALTSTTSTSGANQTLPTSTSYPARMLAAFWDDLVLGNGKVSWAVVGNAPERILVIQWTNVQLKSDATSSLTFQAQVFQTGVIRYVYKTMNFGMATPSYTVGSQNSDRSDARVHAFGIASNAEVTLFGPKSAPLPAKAVLGGPYPGFVKMSGGYTRVLFHMPQLLQFGTVRLTEVMYRPSVPGSEYVELFNANEFPLELHGFQLSNGTGALILDRAVANTIVPPGGTYVVGKSANPAENDGLGSLINYSYGNTFDLPDTGATLLLTKGTGEMTRRTYEETSTEPAVAQVYDPGLYRVSGGTSGTNYFVPCGAGVSQTFGSQSPEQRGTPGQITSCDGFVMTRIPVSYYDISLHPDSVNLYPSTSNLSLGGAFKTQPLTGGATFPFYGTAYSEVRMTGYGYLNFSNETLPSSANSYSGVTMPTSTSVNGTIAIFADLLYKNASKPEAGVFYKFVPENEDPNTPDLHWIFQWKHANQGLNSSTSEDDMNFQVKLFKDGAFEFHYGVMESLSSSNYANGNSAVIWVENPSGTRALFYAANNTGAVITSNMALRFEPR